MKHFAVVELEMREETNALCKKQRPGDSIKQIFCAAGELETTAPAYFRISLCRRISSNFFQTEA